MRIKLIAPRWRGGLYGIRTLRVPPLGLGLLAALTPARHEVSITDENQEEIDFGEKVDLAGITVMTPLAPRAYEISKEYAQRDIPVVLGGVHPSLAPAEASRYATAVVIGEAEAVWPTLLSDLEQGKLRRFYQGERPDLASLPPARRDLFDSKAYTSINTIQASRGCPFSCDFCSVTAYLGSTYRFRPVEAVIKEMKALKSNLTYIVDDNIIGNPKYAKELFQAMVHLEIRWAGQASLNIARDRELLKLAKESGCVCLFIGFESLSTEGVRGLHKLHNQVDYQKAIDTIHHHGIGIEGAFIFGLDQDEPAVFEETVDFVFKNNLEAAQFSILTPFPGTPLTFRLERQGRIRSRNWADYDAAHVVFEPLRMSQEQLQGGFHWAWHQCYSYTSIFQRLWHSRAPRGFHIPFNLALKRAASLLPEGSKPFLEDRREAAQVSDAVLRL